MLKGKCAIVTGSTSGIGLGIARALAGVGANVMLNGFGDAQEIEKLRAGLAAEFKVKVVFNGANSAQSTFSSTTPAFSTRRRSRTSTTRAGTR
jgi:3-hydroxybutyrate dehydrogenase